MRIATVRVFLALVLVATLVGPVWATASKGDAEPKLEYTVTIVPGGERPRVLIEGRLRGDASGMTKLVVPSSWASEQNYANCIRDLKVLTNGATLADTDEPSTKRVTHRPGEEIRFAYELVQDFAGPPSAGRGSGYRPIVQKDYVHWIGHGGWVLPGWSDDAYAKISIRWEGLPKSWKVATSFGTGERQKVRTQFGGFSHAVFAAGDFRVAELRIKDRPVVVAMRGAWSFTDEQFTGLVGKIFEAERGFWNDYDYPYYLITLLSLEGRPGELSVGGTGLTNSFALFVTTNADLGRFRYLLMHELMHNWIPNSVGRMPVDERQLYWFSEGFTDFYTYALLKRSGLISDDEFAEHCNEVLREYSASPVRNEPNARIVAQFFENEDVGKLPYWRGAMLAMRWDSRIREATAGKQSIDDVLLEMFAEWRRDSSREITADLVAGKVSKLVGEDVSGDVKRFVDDGETIVPPADAAGPGYELADVQIGVFELGFDLDTIVKEKRIDKVIPGSAAYEAGLRDGQAIVRRKPIHVGDAGVPVEVTIKDGDAERTISYLPVSRAKRTVPQFRRRS